ncbi:MAG: hypothetical protein ABIY52_12030 [Gemmatimonadaceae bacterium]
MPKNLRLALVFAALASSPAALLAQSNAAAPDSIAYPRQYVNWVLTSQGDSAWAHSGAQLREAMKSAQGVNQMAMRVATRFGEVTSTDAEIQFDEGPLKVYIAVMTFSLEAQPGAWVVAYSPTTRVVERASFGPLARVKASYPQAKLP